MIGNPKYEYGNIVSFRYITDDDKVEIITGRVCIVDAYGTFEQNEEPSYDIMVDNWLGTETQMLVKHIRESHII